MIDDELIQYIRDRNDAINFIMMNNYVLEKDCDGRYQIWTLTDSNYGNNIYGSLEGDQLTPITFHTETSAFNWLSHKISSENPQLIASVTRDLKTHKGV